MSVTNQNLTVTVRIDGETFEVQIESLHSNPVTAVIDGVRYEVWTDQNHQYGNAAQQAQALAAPSVVVTQRDTDVSAQHIGAKHVTAPIPGVIISVAVRSGDVVKTGQDLCVLEAMKMKNAVRSPRSGEIQAVHVIPGQHVQHREVLVEFTD